MGQVNRRRRPATKPLRALHRWLGIAAAAFLLLLCLSGILLNHSSALGLDSKFVGSRWLLDRYGITTPDPGPAFAVAGRWVTLIGTRLYLDDEPVADVPALVGAVPVGDRIAAVTPAEVLIVSAGGTVSERWPIAVETGAPITAAASIDAGVALRTASAVYLFDAGDARIRRFDSGGEGLDWVEPATPDDRLVTTITEDYRGSGLSVERVLADLHSGRLAGLSGVVVMDLAAVAVVILALTGIVIWIRR